MLDPKTVLDIINTGGAVGAFILFFLAVGRGWFIPGQVYRDVKRDRDDWKEIALKGTDAARRAVTVAERRRSGRDRPVED
jgi:hypothetical protein